MTEPTDQLRARLQSSKQSITKPREIVFAVLMNNEPLAMQELVSACHDQIDRASVYRTIALFEWLGIVQRLQIGWKYKLELTDTFIHHHHHLTCTVCGRTIPLPEDSQLEQLLQTLATSQGFESQDHQLEIRGVCDSCRTKQYC
jgi:Fur family ferric uptake transcriptional regulator